MASIGLFGATFDPPTLGHLDVLKQAENHFKLIYLIPSANHPFKKNSSSFKMRLQLAEMFINDIKGIINNARIKICTIENDILEQHPAKFVYTFDMLSTCEKLNTKNRRLVFILGEDNIKKWKFFYKSKDIDDNWSIFTAKERSSIHSTLVRDLLYSEKRNASKYIISKLDRLVTPSVREFIVNENIYRN